MEELFRSSLPFQAALLLLAFLLCLAPGFGRKGRVTIVVLLLLPALGIAVDLLVDDHASDTTLEVPNVFGRGPDLQPHVWVVDRVTAALWAWHIAMIAVLALPALAIWLTRRRPVGAPRPVWFGALLFWYVLAARLALELTAAHRPIVWGFGASVTLLAVLPCFGYWCGARGVSAGGFVARLVLLAIAQRAPLAALAWLATTQHLGTHLDVHVVTDIATPVFGTRELATDFERWLWAILLPQLALWVEVTVLFGAALGILPFWLGRRRRAEATP
ncbi:MAG: hypothetical protein KDE27_29370 [Planctomycetes bacterium]|nr:hypothetical protein [Planctomycetota bacterium]